MPLNFLRRGAPKPPPEAAPPAGEPVRASSFDAFTEEWRLTATIRLEGRLSDALNRREALEIANVAWAPIDGSAPISAAPRLAVIDPYDLVLVIAGMDTLPPLSDAEQIAYRVHKVAYDVLLEVPPFRIIGTVAMRPGADPLRLTDRSTELFVPVLEALVLLGGTPVGDFEDEVVLVNRSFLHLVEQVDRAAARAELLRATDRS